MAFVWELTKETIHLPPGCLQGGRGNERKVETSAAFAGVFFFNRDTYLENNKYASLDSELAVRFRALLLLLFLLLSSLELSGTQVHEP